MNITQIEERRDLRYIFSRLQEARKYAVMHRPDTDLVEYIDAALAATELQIEPLLIKSEGKDPLNAEEEVIHNNLQAFLRFNDEEWQHITPEQRFSAARIIAHQGGPRKIQHPVSGGHSRDMIGINFGYIFIGIEPDGYAHS